MPKPIIYIHIPKTGGSSFTNALVKGYDIMVGRRKFEDMQKFIERIQSMKRVPDAVCCHMPYGIHEYLPNNFRYVTCLREPVSLVLSNYYYRLWRHPNGLERCDITKGLELRKGFNNVQTRILCGIERLYLGEEANEPILYDEEILEKAKANLSTFAVVGVTEEFDKFYETVKLEFDLEDIGEYITTNVTPTYTLADEQPAEVIEKIKELNQMDLKLYEYAKTLAP